MKKIMATVLCSGFLLSGCSNDYQAATPETPSPSASTETYASENTPDTTTSIQGNFSDEMKIPYTVDLDIYGADCVERDNDYQSSPYFNHPDFYNMESTDTLTILSNFKTQQQTSEWSCGLSAMLMVMEHYGITGEHNEETLATMRHVGMEPVGTPLLDIVTIFEELGIPTESTYDFPDDEIYNFLTLEQVRTYLEKDIPIIIGWNDWGAHWQVIIGYDTMGTETQSDDVIIVADSYDTTDHNQDGYGIYPAERLYYNWTMYDWVQNNFGLEERDYLFCVIFPDGQE